MTYGLGPRIGNVPEGMSLAAVGVGDRNDIVDVRVARQELGLDPLHGIIDRGRDTLDSRRDA